MVQRKHIAYEPRLFLTVGGFQRVDYSRLLSDSNNKIRTFSDGIDSTTTLQMKRFGFFKGTDNKKNRKVLFFCLFGKWRIYGICQ